MFSPRALALLLPLTLFLSACSGPTIKDSRDVYNEVLAQQAEETTVKSDFEPGLVSLISQDSGNYLFRGNMPISNKTFRYKELRASLEQAAPGKVLPKEIYLVDISLINSINPNEAADLEIETSFWKTNSTLGRLINHPVYGSLTSPNDYPKKVRRQLEKIPTLSNTDVLLENIHSLLQSRQLNGVPLVLYIHCEAGKDRTGEIAAAYAMKYQQSSYADAYANAKRIAKRDLGKNSRNELQWYAYFLKDIKKVSTVGDIR